MPHIFHKRDVPETPWKNGGGVTQELYRLPDPKAPGDFLLRISTARVEQDGPFSIYPGIDRSLLLLDGAGLKLQVPGQPDKEITRPLEPFHFSGETPISCRLIQGPILDFNVMASRSWGTVTVEVEHRQLTMNQWCLVYECNQETLTLVGASESVDFPSGPKIVTLRHRTGPQKSYR